MPCPCFEPRSIVSLPTYPLARLPLLEEYEGLCHASGQPLAVPSNLRFSCCNRGYSRSACPHFPVMESRSALRFDIRKATAEFLELLYLEEQDHAPVHWHSLRYSILADCLEPEFSDICASAQARAFCRSFVRRFSSCR